jgi:rhomboid protease GluP
MENRSPAEQLLITRIAMEQMDWEISEITTQSITAFTRFSFRSWNEQVSATFTEDGELELYSVSTGAQVIDFGRNRENIKRLVNIIEEIDMTITPEGLAAENPLTTAPRLSHSRPVVKGRFGVFRPVSGYFITPILIGINVFIYLLLALVTLYRGGSWWMIDTDLLEIYGANYKEVTLFGEPWRLLSAAFLHADVLHLFFNMYGIMICGVYLEPLLGKWRYLLVYISCAIMASLGSLWWYDITPSIGASGALFGLFGFIFTLLLRRFLPPGERRALLISIGIYIALRLSLVFFTSQIDHAAHISGLLTGMLIAQILYAGLKTPRLQMKSTWAAGSIVLALIISIYFLLPRDVSIYIEKVQKLGYNFTMAQGSYAVGSEKMREKWLQNFGIYYMDENLRIMDEIDSLSLSRDSRERNKIMRKLFLTQRNMFAYSYRTLREGRNAYDKQIIEALHEMSRIRKQLNW